MPPPFTAGRKPPTTQSTVRRCLTFTQRLSPCTYVPVRSLATTPSRPAPS